MKKLFFLGMILWMACTLSGQPSAELKRRWPRFSAVHFEGQEYRVTLLRGAGLPRFYVNVTIGSTTGLLLLDTGASVSVLDAAVGRKEGFVARTSGLATSLSGKSRAMEGTVSSMKIGIMTIDDCAFIVNDLTVFSAREKETQDKTIIGILGADLLDELGAFIDLRQNVLILRRPR